MGSIPIYSTRGIVKWYNSVKKDNLFKKITFSIQSACHAKVLGSIPSTSAKIGEYFNWLEGHLDGW